MYKETHSRAMIKAISYRVFGSIITAIIIYAFVGRVDFALAGGLADAIAKIFAYYFHERMWNKIKLGKKMIEPFNIWFTGLPCSGKTSIANSVFDKLKKFHIPLERIDGEDVRSIIPNIGFSREERNAHIQRVGYLLQILQKNAISTVASFVSPYEESRQTIRDMVKNTMIIYVKADIETCQKRDIEGKYKKAFNGEIKNFTGVSDKYEEPEDADIVIDTDKLSIDEASSLIIHHIKKRYIR